MRLRKLNADFDPTDRRRAMDHVQAMAAQGEYATGLLYVDPQAGDLHAALHTVGNALNTLDERALCPGAATLAAINQSLR
jgi:2-oxoglutarate ferredoxin oxidoreductase subunit beta